MASPSFDYTDWPSVRRSRRARYLLVVFWIAILIAYLCAAAKHRDRVNLSAAAAGQYPYLVYAKGMAEHGLFGFMGDRNRMPLAPAIFSLAYQRDWESFFHSTTWLSIALSMMVLGGIGCTAYATLPVWPATAFTLAAVVTVFIQRASFVGAELLYYAMLFGCWLLTCRLILRPSFRWGAITGVVLAITYLTKASALLSIVAFLGTTVVQLILLPFTQKTLSDLDRNDASRTSLRSLFTSAITVILMFLIVSFPYIRTSRRHFGSWFYNVNSSYFMWCESWAEARRFANDNHVEREPPKVAPDEIPGPENYWHTHSAYQIIHRLAYGFRTLARLAVEGRAFKYLAAAALLFLILGIRQGHRLREMAVQHWPVVLFCLLFFGIQLLCFAWYAQVAYGDRFAISLLLPTLFAFFWIDHRLSLATTAVPLLGRRVRKSDLLAIAMCLALLGEGTAMASSSLYRPTETFVRFYFNESHELMEEANLDEAARGFRGVIEFEPSFAPAHRDLGMTALISGRFEEAIAPLSEAARLEPLNADIRNSLGSAFLQSGRIAEAIREFKQAAQLAPAMSVAWFNLGISYLKAGQRDDAEAVLLWLSPLDSALARKLSKALQQ